MVYRVSIHDFCAQGLRAELRPGGWLDKRYELTGPTESGGEQQLRQQKQLQLISQRLGQLLEQR